MSTHLRCTKCNNAATQKASMPDIVMPLHANTGHPVAEDLNHRLLWRGTSSPQTGLTSLTLYAVLVLGDHPPSSLFLLIILLVLPSPCPTSTLLHPPSSLCHLSYTFSFSSSFDCFSSSSSSSSSPSPSLHRSSPPSQAPSTVTVAGAASQDHNKSE